MNRIIKTAKKPYVAVALKCLRVYNWTKRNDSIAIWQRKQGDTVNTYLNDIDRPDRHLLIDKIAGFKPESVLEVGCFVGVNLYLLGQRLPNVKLYGIDPNNLAVFEGNSRFGKYGNIQLATGDSHSLIMIPSNSFDVVFTRAVLLHIGNDDIQEALKHMLRIAKKGLVFLEWQDFTGRLKDKDEGWLDGHWVRHYDKMIKKIMPGVEVRITELKRDVWPEWNDHGGAYIEVIK